MYTEFFSRDGKNHKPAGNKFGCVLKPDKAQFMVMGATGRRGGLQERVIMLIEDNQDDIELTQRAFRRNNIEHELVTSRDGAEALEYLFAPEGRRKYDLPVFILMDLKLPRMNGLEVLKRIRENERTRLIPVVVLTSSTEERDIADSYSLGANSYIRKPVDFTEFTETVRKLADYWLQINESPFGGD